MAVAVAVAVAVSGGGAVAAAVPVTGLTKRFFHPPKRFLNQCLGLTTMPEDRTKLRGGITCSIVGHFPLSTSVKVGTKIILENFFGKILMDCCYKEVHW